jgi:hypothetical protein
MVELVALVGRLGLAPELDTAVVPVGLALVGRVPVPLLRGRLAMAVVQPVDSIGLVPGSALLLVALAADTLLVALEVPEA